MGVFATRLKFLQIVIDAHLSIRFPKAGSVTCFQLYINQNIAMSCRLVDQITTVRTSDFLKDFNSLESTQEKETRRL